MWFNLDPCIVHSVYVSLLCIFHCCLHSKDAVTLPAGMNFIASEVGEYEIAISWAQGMYGIYCTEARGCKVTRELCAINPIHPKCTWYNYFNIPWAQLPWIHSRERRDRLILLTTVLQSRSQCQTWTSIDPLTVLPRGWGVWLILLAWQAHEASIVD